MLLNAKGCLLHISHQPVSKIQLWLFGYILYLHAASRRSGDVSRNQPLWKTWRYRQRYTSLHSTANYKLLFGLVVYRNLYVSACKTITLRTFPHPTPRLLPPPHPTPDFCDGIPRVPSPASSCPAEFGSLPELCALWFSPIDVFIQSWL